MSRFFIRVLPCIAMVFAAGCSSYDERFASASRSDVKHLLCEGAYSGRWTSASHPGGGGDLRCILTQVNARDLRADFHATWHGFSSSHTVVLQTSPAARKKPGGSMRAFEGTSKLRTIIGAGDYTCQGTMSNQVIQACYDATYDRGTFELHRVYKNSPQRR